nr:MAG TPA: hypothetical protein [Caudoviricetes sp.]
MPIEYMQATGYIPEGITLLCLFFLFLLRRNLLSLRRVYARRSAISPTYITFVLELLARIVHGS